MNAFTFSLKQKMLRLCTRCIFFRFLPGSTYDVLPSLHNLKCWMAGKPSCSLYVLSVCKVNLSQGRYKWWRNQVLKRVVAQIESKRQQVNSGFNLRERTVVQFVCEGGKCKRGRFLDLTMTEKVATEFFHFWPHITFWADLERYLWNLFIKYYI